MDSNETTKSKAVTRLLDEEIRVSNALIRGAHSLSLSEKRVVYICLSKLQEDCLIDGRYKFRLTAKEFSETFEIDLDTAYTQLKSAKRLMKKVARTIEETPEGKKEQIFVWVSGVTYHHGEGWVEIGFSHEMTPHLFEIKLSNGFTRYYLKQTSALRSVYAWRLFELMMQFKSSGLLKIGIEDFYYAMEAPLSCKKDFFNLKKRIIEPAVNELREKNNMQIVWEYKKKDSRKVTGLEFRFNKNQNAETLLA
jgi:plasmid replication initiation protein